LFTLIEVTDAKGRKTISEYDKPGRLISVTYLGGNLVDRSGKSEGLKKW
jgi:YD repeat-containing protein